MSQQDRATDQAAGLASLSDCPLCGHPLAEGHCYACGGPYVVGCFPATQGPEPAVPVEERLAWGQHVREIRRVKGISQRALGEAAGVDFTYISRIENGTFPPPAGRTIEWIAGVLGVDAVELAREAGKVLPGYVERLEHENHTLRESRAAVAAENGRLRAALQEQADWMVGEDGPLHHEWREGYIGHFEDHEMDWPECRDALEGGGPIWTEPTIRPTGYVEQYRRLLDALDRMPAPQEDRP